MATSKYSRTVAAPYLPQDRPHGLAYMCCQWLPASRQCCFTATAAAVWGAAAGACSAAVTRQSCEAGYWHGTGRNASRSMHLFSHLIRLNEASPPGCRSRSTPSSDRWGGRAPPRTIGSVSGCRCHSFAKDSVLPHHTYLSPSSAMPSPCVSCCWL